MLHSDNSEASLEGGCACSHVDFGVREKQLPGSLASDPKPKHAAESPGQSPQDESRTQIRLEAAKVAFENVVIVTSQHDLSKNQINEILQQKKSELENQSV